MKVISLAIGSLFGGFSRAAVSAGVKEMLGTAFPYGTLVVNLSGCFVVGFFHAFLSHRPLFGRFDRVLLMTGFCGAYTTFSGWILQSSELAKEGRYPQLGLNVLGSLVFGFLFLRLGEWFGAQF